MAEAASPQYEFDEEARFNVHSASHIEDTLERFGRIRGVRGAAVIELVTGEIIASTLPVAEAAQLSQHVPMLMHHASTCLRSCGDGTLALLAVRSRKTEWLLCDDAASGTAIIVEQDIAAAAADAERPTRGSGAAKRRGDSRRRLLIGQPGGSPVSPGHFASDMYDAVEGEDDDDGEEEGVP